MAEPNVDEFGGHIPVAPFPDRETATKRASLPLRAWVEARLARRHELYRDLQPAIDIAFGKPALLAWAKIIVALAFIAITVLGLAQIDLHLIEIRTMLARHLDPPGG